MSTSRLRFELKLFEAEGVVQGMVRVEAEAWFELEDKVQVELRGHETSSRTWVE